jgi:MtN3 and saliva related transmembrane protein
MIWITSIGLFAAFCTTVAFLPQVCKIVRTKQTKDISLLMYTTFVAGVFAWLVYGLLIRDIPLLVANAITFLLSGWVLILKIKYE